MCSDGLTNMLEDEEIRMIISGARDLVEKAESLVECESANNGEYGELCVVADSKGQIMWEWNGDNGWCMSD